MIGATSRRESVRDSVGSYLLSHWRGALPLAVAFWVNLVLLRGCVLLAEGFSDPGPEFGAAVAALGAMLYVFAVHVGLHAWQIVGVVRACDRYQTAEGAVVPAYGAYLGIAISLLFPLRAPSQPFR